MQRGSRGAYMLSNEEAQNDVSQYGARMRTHRLLQVLDGLMLLKTTKTSTFLVSCSIVEAQSLFVHFLAQYATSTLT